MQHPSEIYKYLHANHELIRNQVQCISLLFLLVTLNTDMSVGFTLSIFDALRNLVPFVQFEKREKQPWMSVTFSKVTGFNLQLNSN